MATTITATLAAAWYEIAALMLLAEGILVAVLAYRGPGVPRTRAWPPTAPDAYVFEEEWRQRHEPVGRIKRSMLRMALPPFVLGVVFFVLTAWG